MSKLYIAYGSNLNKEQMKFRCPDAQLVGVGEIPNYQLLFRGGRNAVATIEPQEGKCVPFGLWKISDRDELALDRYEGYPNLYYKKSFAMQIQGQSAEAMAYIMDTKYEIGVPSQTYYQTIQQGYRDCGLDCDVLDDAVQRSRDIYHKQLDMEAMQMGMK